MLERSLPSGARLVGMLVMHVSRARRDCTTDRLARRIGPALTGYAYELLGREEARATSRGFRIPG